MGRKPLLTRYCFLRRCPGICFGQVYQKIVNSNGNRYFCSESITRARVHMIRYSLSLCLRFFKSRIQLQLEIIFLRKQIEILTRTSRKPRLRHFDRLFFSTMTTVFDSWKETLLVIKPETVIRWHRQSFRLFWRWKSRHKKGRPKIPQAQINMIKQMANENPLWGAPRIHGELLKLGFDISEATVLRYMPKKSRTTTGQRLPGEGVGEQLSRRRRTSGRDDLAALRGRA